MKLLHIIGSMNPASGGPIEGILRQHSVTQACVTKEIACCDEPGAPWLSEIPMQVHALGRERGQAVNPVRRFLDHYGYTPRLVPWLRENVQAFDAVIVHGLWNYSTFAATRILPGSGIPYFVFTHGQMDPWFRKAYPIKDFVKQIFWWFNEGLLLKRANAVLFTCEEERRLVRGRYLGHQGYQEAVVGYGTTEPPPATQDQIAAFRACVPNLDPERNFLLFLSRIHQKKGCDLLTEAFARIAPQYPGLDLVIAGPDREGLAVRLQKRAHMLGVAARIHWPGMIKGDAKWGAFRSAEAFILPSHSENFGIVVAEAMACGTPVLTTNKVNIWREVEGCGGGFIEPDTLEGTQALMVRWLALSPEAQYAMGTTARAGFDEHFRMEKAAENLLTLVRQALREGETGNS